MTKKELVDSCVEMNDGMSKKDVTNIIDAVFETMKDSLVEGEDVSIPGFGTFTTIETAARQGRNPATGKTIQIAASCRVKFKPAKGLKDAVKG